MRTLASTVVMSLLLVFLAGCSETLTSVEVDEVVETVQATNFTDLTEADIASLKSVAKEQTVVEMTVLESSDGLDWFSSRKDYNNAVPEGPPFGPRSDEDFEGESVFGINTCPGPIEWISGGAGCYTQRRELIREFVLDDQHALMGQVTCSGGVFTPTTVAGPNAFADNAVVYFDKAAAAGFDLFDPFGSTWTVTAYGADGALGSVVTGSGFVGVKSDEHITSIVITGASGLGAELLDDLTFSPHI